MPNFELSRNSVECDRCGEVFTDESSYIVHGESYHGDKEEDFEEVEDTYELKMDPNLTEANLREAKKLLAETNQQELYHSRPFKNPKAKIPTKLEPHISADDLVGGVSGYNDDPNSFFYNNKKFRKGDSKDRYRTSELGESISDLDEDECRRCNGTGLEKQDEDADCYNCDGTGIDPSYVKESKRRTGESFEDRYDNHEHIWLEGNGPDGTPDHYCQFCGKIKEIWESYKAREGFYEKAKWIAKAKLEDGYQNEADLSAIITSTLGGEPDFNEAEVDVAASDAFSEFSQSQSSGMSMWGNVKNTESRRRAREDSNYEVDVDEYLKTGDPVQKTGGGRSELELNNEERITGEAHDLNDQSSDFQFQKSDSSDLLRTDQKHRNADGSIASSDDWYPNQRDQDKVGRADVREADNYPQKAHMTDNEWEKDLDDLKTRYETENEDVGYDDLGTVTTQGEEQPVGDIPALESINFGYERYESYPTIKVKPHKTKASEVYDGIIDQYEKFQATEDEDVTEMVTAQKLQGSQSESIAKSLTLRYGVSREDALEKVYSIEVSNNDRIANTFFQKKFSECSEAEISELRLYCGSDE